MARFNPTCFDTANPLYAGATVTIYTVNGSGQATTTLATIYDATTGTGTLANPQTLNSEGRFAVPIYLAEPVIMSVSGTVAAHSTGIQAPSVRNRGTWATATLYAEGDIVRDGAAGANTGNTYICEVRHTSGTWATDLTAVRWTVFADLTAQVSAAAASASAALASENAAAISAAAAAAAAGSGLFVSLSNQNADFSVVADTDNATLFIVDTSGANVSATLPSIAAAGETERYGFLRTSASNVMTLVRNGSDTINGVAANYTVPASAGEIFLILADDASPDNWIVISWSQAVADETTLTKTGGTLSIKGGGVGATQLATNAVTTIKIADANVTGPKLGGGSVGAVGFTATSHNAGTKSSGTYTPDPANGNFQYAVNGGAHTLAPPASDCTMIVQYTNNGSAGAVTTSGFTRVTGSFTTTNGDDFLCFITRLNGFTHLNIVALQ